MAVNNVVTILFVWAAVTTVFGILIDKPNGRIAGGSRAGVGEFPFMVSVEVNGIHKCGGFIYNDRHVITTASCIDGELPINTRVVIGRTSLNIPEEEVQRMLVQRIIPHESYQSATRVSDLAVIETIQPIVFGNTAQPIYYDNVDSMIKQATVMGWGSQGQINDPVSVRLQKVVLSVPGNCANDPSFDNRMQICAGGTAADNGGPCGEYDLGSPIVQQNFIVGIASKNLNCGSSGSVYTRLSSYYSWLTANAGLQPAYRV